MSLFGTYNLYNRYIKYIYILGKNHVTYSQVLGILDSAVKESCGTELD